MTEHEAQQIIDMYESQWHKLAAAAALWKGFLLREDAAIVTKAIARLATTAHGHPDLADLAEVVGTMRPLHAKAACPTCGDDRFVVVSLRPATSSSWMAEHELEPAEGLVCEETAACPDCNADAETSFKRHDNSYARALDPATVRERMNS